MISVNSQNFNVYPVNYANLKDAAPVDSTKITPETTVSKPSFKAQAYTSAVTVRTQLTTKEEKKQYKELSEGLDSKYRKKLEYALKSGVLLKNNSNDNSSVLTNLYKIYKEPRDPGLDPLNLLKESLDIISNPYVITQTCEDIPKEYRAHVLGLMTNVSENKQELREAEDYLRNMHTGTCPTASVEFDLATKNPAEFFRIVEGLTSPNNEALKIINKNSLSDKDLDAKWLLNKFKTPHKIEGDKVMILLKPDDNALIRARIQNTHRDPGERSMIDVLMQSTMMQLGSQQTYDSLTDKRKPNEWSQDDGGLINFEKTYVESVMEDKNTELVTYQIMDEEMRVTGHAKDFASIKKDLIDTLNMGHNIIIGYTFTDPDTKKCVGGHEITIVGYKENPNGEGVFICQDSDDNVDKPIEMKESFLLKNLHHAGLPKEIAYRDGGKGL